MDIFSNWIFWVVLAAILFILAIIGYLSESRKRSKKKEENKNETSINDNPNVVASTTTDAVSAVKNDDWTTMPEVSVAPLNVENNAQTQAETNVASAPDTLNMTPVEPVSTPEALNVSPVEPVSTPEALNVSPVEPLATPEALNVSPVEPLATPDISTSVSSTDNENTTDTSDKSNNVWNS